MRNSLKLYAELFTTSDIGAAKHEDKTVYLVPVIAIDDTPIVDFTVYATCVSQLQESTARSGNFWILTCWCGISECANINRPVYVTHEQDVVAWIVSEPKHGEYTFDMHHYQHAISEGIHRIRRELADLKQPDMTDESLSLVPGLPNDMDILEIRRRMPGRKRKHAHARRQKPSGKT